MLDTLDHCLSHAEDKSEVMPQSLEPSLRCFVVTIKAYLAIGFFLAFVQVQSG